MSAKKSFTPSWALALLVLCVPALAFAQNVFAPSGGSGGSDNDAKGIDILFEGWSSFSNGWMLLDMCAVLVMALILGAFIAYHPSTRRRVSSLDHFEQPKTFLMYAMVAAVVALIVKVQPAMAFVIFGIGGLLRFRTMVGEAKDTGRVILVTVLGLCCGLKIYVVALPAAVIGWLVIYFLEQQIAGIIRISGVAKEKLREAVESHRALIEKGECSIIGEQSKFQKREFLFVVSAQPSFDREALQTEFETLPEELRGKVDWERL
jgi:uncharacterized membrane protein YhiD involved in acid resistance